MTTATSSLYFMLAAPCEMGFYCKIGISDNPKKRIKEIQVGCPHKIDHIAMIELKHRTHARLAETMFHKSFAHYRTIGEWFLFDSHKDWIEVAEPFAKLIDRELDVIEL